MNLSVFYESLCPDSIRFFVNQLQPTYNELRSIMTVDTHAYGKANVSLLTKEIVYKTFVGVIIGIIFSR